MSKKMSIVLAVLLIAAAVFGCSSAAPTSTATAPTAKTEPAPAKTDAAAQPAASTATAGTEAAATEAPKEPKTLTFADSDLRTEVLDPFYNTDLGAQELLSPVYECLLGVNIEGAITPELAESWESSDDLKVWTLHIRKGVQFHEGYGEMTAEDVVWSLKRMTGEGSQMSSALEIQDLVESIEASDAYTVVITLKEPVVDFVTIHLRGGSTGGLGMVMCKKYYETAGEETFKVHPVGTGRWQFDSFDPGNYVKYKAVSEHWSNILPGFDYLVMQEVSEDGTRSSMIERGDVDMIDVSTDMAINLKDKGFNVIMVDRTVVGGIRFWGTWEEESKAAGYPITDVRVRKAIILAINKEEICETYFGGLYNPVALPAGADPAAEIVDEEYWTNWAKENYRYDPEAAKALLAEAGYPNGFKMTMFTANSARGPWHVDITNIVAGYLAAVGIEVDVQSVDQRGVFNPMIKSIPHTEPLLGTCSVSSGEVDPYPAARIIKHYYPGNYYQLLDPNDAVAVDALGALRSETDPAKRHELFNTALLEIAEQYVYPTLFVGGDSYVIGPRVKPCKVYAGTPIPGMWAYLLQPAD